MGTSTSARILFSRAVTFSMALALRASLAGSSSNPLATLAQTFQTLWQLPGSLLELLPPIVLAVPKSKVSHSRKRMRSANKGLKEKLNVVTCPGCGRAKRAHHICPNCYSEISRSFKAAIKSQISSTAPQARPTATGPKKGDEPKEGRSIADGLWARSRGGAQPLKPGELLTKWMRRRAGFGKEDPTVRVGQDIKFVGRQERRRLEKQERQSVRSRKEDDEDDSSTPSGGASLPPNLTFA